MYALCVSSSVCSVGYSAALVHSLIPAPLHSRCSSSPISATAVSTCCSMWSLSSGPPSPTTPCPSPPFAHGSPRRRWGSHSTHGCGSGPCVVPEDPAFLKCPYSLGFGSAPAWICIVKSVSKTRSTLSMYGTHAEPQQYFKDYVESLVSICDMAERTSRSNFLTLPACYSSIRLKAVLWIRIRIIFANLDPDPHQIKIRIRIRIKVISRIRNQIRIRIICRWQAKMYLVWNMSLL